ncbi:large ribosomal subunit protein bL33m [Sinocyclocheilus grahami]|uniref:Large ribosomal subunit protein bL33m n=3 Tax=Cyprininae TaxID=2743694 RepID=A0A672TC28_SINGR|nr:PREDICTED: 39S ribosomal protein L33, mitochondrial [Sinocyclocheilus grahami]
MTHRTPEALELHPETYSQRVAQCDISERLFLNCYRRIRMFLTTVNLAKSKSKTLLVQMVSAAGTGYCFNTKRGRLRDKLVLRKHDPIVNKHVLFIEKRKIRSL